MASMNIDSAGLAELGKVIGESIGGSQRRQKTIGEYQREQAKGHVKLKRSCSQNGYDMSEATLSNEEITLLNRVTRPGRYIDRMVEVVIRNEGGEEEVEFRYSNKSVDQRFASRAKYRTLVEMLTLILEAQDLEIATEPARKSA